MAALCNQKYYFIPHVTEIIAIHEDRNKAHMNDLTLLTSLSGAVWSHTVMLGVSLVANRIWLFPSRQK